MAREVLENVKLVVVGLVVLKNLVVEVRARNVDPVVVLFLSLVGVESSGSGGTLCRPKSWRENGRVKTAAMFSSGWASRNPIT